MASPTQKERRASPRKPAAKPPETTVRPSQTSARVQVSPDEIRRLIAEAAYFRAKERGFTPGYELEDWVQAEAEVKTRLASPR